MAKIVENSKGFKVIKLSIEDAELLGFGIYGSGVCVCSRCNKPCVEDIYYIAVLNDTMCKDCYEEWIKNAKRYSEDICFEERNFDFYKKGLNL